MNKKQNKLHLLAGLAAALIGAAAVNGVCGEFAWLDPTEFTKDLKAVEVPSAAQPARAGPSALMEGAGWITNNLFAAKAVVFPIADKFGEKNDRLNEYNLSELCIAGSDVDAELTRQVTEEFRKIVKRTSNREELLEAKFKIKAYHRDLSHVQHLCLYAPDIRTPIAAWTELVNNYSPGQAGEINELYNIIMYQPERVTPEIEREIFVNLRAYGKRTTGVLSTLQKRIAIVNARLNQL